MSKTDLLGLMTLGITIFYEPGVYKLTRSAL